MKTNKIIKVMRKKSKCRESPEQILQRLSERMFPDRLGHFKITLETTENDGDSALHALLYSDENYPAKTLIEAGADINLKGNQGFTPLHVAAWRGNALMIEYLLEKGASSSIKCSNGKTAYDIAQEEGHKICTTILRK